MFTYSYTTRIQSFRALYLMKWMMLEWIRSTFTFYFTCVCQSKILLLLYFVYYNFKVVLLLTVTTGSAKEKGELELFAYYCFRCVVVVTFDRLFKMRKNMRMMIEYSITITKSNFLGNLFIIKYTTNEYFIFLKFTDYFANKNWNTTTGTT